ncbi:TPA: ferritin-like domain-containing protein [bacterium]|nr:ferritin-like domain-containing protein [bacterium]
MNNEEVIKMLNADITGEIEAILTYLRHQFVCGVCEISHTMEETAMDEMRHVEWLSETVVDLGGIPTIEHAELHLEGEDLPAMLKRDVGLEESAIKQYEEHIDAITDPKIRRLLKKIMNEEIEHQEEFSEKLHELSFIGEESKQEINEKPELTVGSLKEGGDK